MIASIQPEAPRPDWIDGALIEKTIIVWSRRYGRSLTQAEALEILLAIGRLVDVLGDK